ncbi:MAG: hypothetical protein AAGC80_15445 [Rhodococcus sp. (in: high G+C Gram-positive bacteria)]
MRKNNGRHVVGALLAAGSEVVGIDRTQSDRSDIISVVADLGDYGQTFDALGSVGWDILGDTTDQAFDIVVHLAARTSFQRGGCGRGRAEAMMIRPRPLSAMCWIAPSHVHGAGELIAISFRSLGHCRRMCHTETDPTLTEVLTVSERSGGMSSKPARSIDRLECGP